MKHKGILLVISGFAGTGKGTLVNELLKRYDNYALSVSATTRQPRAGEEDGVHYFFKTREEFQQMIDDDSFIEYAEYVDHFYGTPRAYVEEQLLQGRNVILEIEMQGALKVKAKFPDTLLLFVAPPSAEVLQERLIRRGTEESEVIAQRLRRAVKEAEYIDQYDYLIVNDDLDVCVQETHDVIHSEQLKVTRSQEFVKALKKDLQRFERI